MKTYGYKNSALFLNSQIKFGFFSKKNTKRSIRIFLAKNFSVSLSYLFMQNDRQWPKIYLDIKIQMVHFSKWQKKINM